MSLNTNASLEGNLNLPPEFLALVVDSLGAAHSNLLLERLKTGRSLTSIRLNREKLYGWQEKKRLTEAPEKCIFGENIAGRVAWCEDGFYLKERPQFTLDPLLHAGAYYVQEASSMYMQLIKAGIEQECCRQKEERFFDQALAVLDLCAAPGGKTTHLASLLNKESILVANEVIKSRATILADNVAKWGASQVFVSNNDPKEVGELKATFHLAIVDAPCSGEGLFGKDSQAVQEWSLSHVMFCSERQQRILADVWPALKPGGFLVYSTCTYNHFENDDILLYLQEEFDAQLIPIEIPAESGIIVTSRGGLQFIPGLVEGEGQFVALLRKPTNNEQAGRHERKYVKGKAKVVCPFMPQEYLPLMQGDLIVGIPIKLFEQIFFFRERLRTVLSGVAVASVKGKDFIPHADFALLAGTAHSVIPVVELSKEDALKFLAKEPLIFEDTPLGYLLLAYRGIKLGFVKNLGNRSNNLLPMARRIRMNIK